MPMAGSRTTEEAQVRAVIDELVTAVREKDAEGVVSHFAENTVMFVLAPPLQFTSEDSPGAEGVEQWFSTFQGPVGYEMRDQRITAGDDVAFSHSLVHISGTRTENASTGTEEGEQTDIWVRDTLCLRKSGGEWKIAHQHQSVPFYMDGSQRAATDLKP